MNIGLIIARGGSKRIPRKNIKLFAGQPIITYSIKTALESKSIDRVIVSTDCFEISEIAKSTGAEVPFVRPARLSDDYASTMDVVLHAVEWLEKHDRLSSLCCIYPTAPLLDHTDIDEAYKLFSDQSFDYVFSAVEFSYPIQRALKFDGINASMFQPQHSSSRSQDLEKAYHDAGQFIWCNPAAIKENIGFFEGNSSMFVMDKLKAQDIDTLSDWAFAEALYKFKTLDEQ